ncbi:hypothetical protein [Yoonia sp. SDW83-1]|uniref:hypothetical protein n=1 Tax=Yoonia sp. SDW83-1 TaxID=3366945 RepID=UPI00398C4FF0
MAKLIKNDANERALANIDHLGGVGKTQRHNTRLPATRSSERLEAALSRDYAGMQEVIIGEAPSFDIVEAPVTNTPKFWHILRCREGLRGARSRQIYCCVVKVRSEQQCWRVQKLMLIDSQAELPPFVDRFKRNAKANNRLAGPAISPKKDDRATGAQPKNITKTYMEAL